MMAVTPRGVSYAQEGDWVSESQLDNVQWPAFFRFIEGRTIEHLRLKGLDLNDESAQQIAPCVRVSKCLKALDLIHNNIGDEGGNKILTALIINPFITECNLEHNQTEVLFKKALTLCSKLTNKQQAYTIWCHYRLGLLQARQHKYNQAQNFFSKAHNEFSASTTDFSVLKLESNQAKWNQTHAPAIIELEIPLIEHKTKQLSSEAINFTNKE